MKIGLDFDGVLSDCGQLKAEGARELFGVEIPPERFKKELVVGDGLLTIDQYRTLQDRIYGTREFAVQMQPVAGMLDYLPRLVDEGYEILVISSRSGDMLDIAREWTFDLGIDIPFVGVGHGKSKAEAAEGLGVYVDDDLDKLEPLVDIVPARLLFSWGYNAHIDESGVAERIASWEALYDRIAAEETVLDIV